MDIMLSVNPDTVRFIAQKAREFQAKEGLSLPETPIRPSDDDGALQVLADHVDDFSYQEAASTVDDLEPDQQVCLVALMWLGRGDFPVDDWNEALALAEREQNGRTAAYLLATPLLSDYLEEALDLLDYDEP